MKAVLLDRDGVINANRDGYVTSWSQFRFLPGAREALSLLTAADYRLAVVTNQSAVGRGLVSAEQVRETNARMVSALAEGGAHIHHVLCCPHTPEEGCACRKPRPGLLMEATSRLGVHPADTWVIGDWVDDIAAARAAGCNAPVLVLTGRGRRALPLARAAGLHPFFVAPDLLSAARAILSWDSKDDPMTVTSTEPIETFRRSAA